MEKIVSKSAKRKKVAIHDQIQLRYTKQVVFIEEAGFRKKNGKPAMKSRTRHLIVD